MEANFVISQKECRASSGSRDSTKERGKKTKKKETNNSRALSELKQMMKKCENEKAKLESKLSVKNEQIKQNQQKIMKLKKKMENYKFKFTLAELEKIQFQSQIALLEQRAGSSKPTQSYRWKPVTGYDGQLQRTSRDSFTMCCLFGTVRRCCQY